MEQIIIELIADATKLEPALEILRKAGKITEDEEKALAKLATTSNKAFTTANKAASTLLPTLDNVEEAIVSVGVAAEDALGEAMGEAFDEAKKGAKGLGDGVDDLNDKVDKTEKKSKSLKGELRALKEELARLESAGDDGGEAFEQMTVRAAQLEDQIGDTAERVRVLSSDTAGLDAGVEALQGLAGGFQLVTATQELFGAGSEDVQKAIVKLNAIMAITQSLQQAQNFLRGQSILKLKLESAYQAVLAGSTRLTATAFGALGISVQASSTAFKFLRGAIISTGVGALVVLIGGLVAKVMEWTESTDDQKESQDALNEKVRDSNTELEKQIQFLDTINALDIKRAKANGATDVQLIEKEIAAIKKRQALRDIEYKQRLKDSKDASDLIQADIADAASIENLKLDRTEAFNKKQDEINKKAGDRSKELAKKNAEALLEIERRKLEDLSAEMKRVAETETLPFEVRNNAARKYIELQKVIAANAKDAVQNAAKNPDNKITAGDIALAKYTETQQLARITKEGAELRYKIEKDNQGKVADLWKAPDIPDATKEQADELLKITADRLKEEVKKIEDAEKRKLELLKKSIALTASYVDSALSNTAEGNVLKNALSLYQQLAEADQAFKEGQITREEKFQQDRAAVITTATASVQEVVNGFYANSAAQRQAEIDTAIASLQAQKEKEVSVENLTQQQKDDINRRYAAKERALKLKAFEEDKKAKRAAAIINGLLAVTNALATAPTIIAGIALAAAAVITTGLQVARISATTPGFKKGTKNAPRGYAWVGEEGPELMYLKGGEKIWTYNQSNKVNSAWETGSSRTPDEILSGYKMPDPISAEIISYNSSNTMPQIDYNQLGKAVATHVGRLRDIPSMDVNIDENGIAIIAKRGNDRMQIQNKRYKL